MDGLNHLTQARVQNLPSLPSQSSSITAGHYVIKHLEEEAVEAWDSQIQTKIWFKSPPLAQDTIRLINGVKLFAESHDQGFCGDDEQGNWTWLEIAILEKEQDTSPKKIGKEELSKESHMNSFCTKDYTWLGGRVFRMDEDFLSSLEEGNVIAVRLCAQYPSWEIYARKGHLVFDVGSGDGPWPIRPLPCNGFQVPRRRNVKEWFDKAKNPANEEAKELSLFIAAMQKFQSLPPTNQLSYFRIAGIHDYPRNVSWNMDKKPIPYHDDDDVRRKKPVKNEENGSYCEHNTTLFPTWHRCYLLLFERRVSDLMKEEVKNRGRDRDEKWVEAASRWRLPYWDWAANPQLPELVANERIKVIVSWDATTDKCETAEVNNPMYRFQMPGGLVMGDKSYGDYRIQTDGEGPWDVCIGTSRHAISLYSEQNLWVQGHTVSEKVNKAFEKTKMQGQTLKDAVYRLLGNDYIPQYKYFATTKFTDPSGPKGYLSLEAIHNTVHNCIGGNTPMGIGHMEAPAVAAFDPVFWLHHSNVDRLLYLWQQVNGSLWFHSSDGCDDESATTPLRPFRKYVGKHGFYNSDAVRKTSDLGYTYDDSDKITDGEGHVCDEFLRKRINELYGPDKDAFERPETDVDPVINIDYDRYALGGLQYTLFFFIGPVRRNVPYAQQESLAGSMYTFSSPLQRSSRREGDDDSTKSKYSNPATGCSNCNEQADAGVRSRAQVPLTRSIPREKRTTHAEAEKFLKEELSWVAVISRGSLRMPREVFGKGLELSLWIGTNKLPDDRTGKTVFEDYVDVKWDWEEAEL
ncbi:Tyrosinase [Lasiodiplodia theobromae]|uniref:tyrosinase n=1 Tax=Lasiodiplodia theobromae TaxID=45133 RepID=A0A5N5D0M9_9PEZI|nr:Tyrosinase [Lasiodiplodia theobromae]